MGAGEVDVIRDASTREVLGHGLPVAVVWLAGRAGAAHPAEVS